MTTMGDKNWDWGVGNKKDSKAFGTAKVGSEEVELIHGEHPHSRRDNNIYARYPDGRIEEFDGHRVRVGIQLQESNYLKESEMSGDEIRKTCTAAIFFNEFQVYQLGGREWDWTLRQIQTIIPKLMEHPVQLWDAGEREKLVGRKIYYGGIRAEVKYCIWAQGCIVIEPVSDQEWFRRYDGKPTETRTVKVDLLDAHIWWFDEQDE
jgi:hypothetical protein